jgi:NADPH-dependent 2,4-dienoyl-CoA reductase/sulfur reductase-like enzyme
MIPGPKCNVSNHETQTRNPNQSHETMEPKAPQVAIVTGGATGIGFGIAEALAKAGLRVAIGSRRNDVVQQAASQLRASGNHDVIGLPLDVTDRTSVQDFVDQVRKQWDSIDVLVNAAGVNIKNRYRKAGFGSRRGRLRRQQICNDGPWHLRGQRSRRRRDPRDEHLPRRSRHPHP